MFTYKTQQLFKSNIIHKSTTLTSHPGEFLSFHQNTKTIT